MLDYNEAGAQRTFDVLPDGTIVVMEMSIRAGNAGEGGLLKRTQKGDAEGIDAKFVVVEGPYTKRCVWAYMLTGGTTDGHAQASDITQRRLRAILESARGIKPTDVSEAAKKARIITGYADFDGMRFIAKLGVEPAQNGYKAKNTLAEVITPDREEWHPIEQQAKTTAAPVASAGSVAPITKPSWAV